jgi:hypothetical protein
MPEPGQPFDGFPFFPFLPIEGASPERETDGFVGPLDEGLSQELRAAAAPADPGFVTRTFGDRCNAAVARWPPGYG